MRRIIGTLMYDTERAEVCYISTWDDLGTVQSRRVFYVTPKGNFFVVIERQQFVSKWWQWSRTIDDSQHPILQVGLHELSEEIIIDAMIDDDVNPGLYFNIEDA